MRDDTDDGAEDVTRVVWVSDVEDRVDVVLGTGSMVRAMAGSFILMWRMLGIWASAALVSARQSLRRDRESWLSVAVSCEDNLCCLEPGAGERRCDMVE